MNREIKFRAWDKENEEMYDVAMIDMETGEVAYTDHPTGYNADALLEQVELMQCTGLKDKNGKEIYEGDIVRIDDLGIGIVDYEEGRFAMRRREERFCWPVYCRIDHSPFVPEVIGNIYENPELLRENRFPCRL